MAKTKPEPEEDTPDAEPAEEPEEDTQTMEEWFKEERDSFNDFCSQVSSSPYLVDTEEGPSPPLNKDGSLKDGGVEEAEADESKESQPKPTKNVWVPLAKLHEEE